MVRSQGQFRARRSSGADGTPVWDVTTLSDAAPTGRDRRRRRLSLGGAVGTGIAVLVVYLVLSLVVHLFVAAALWLPAIVLAGLAVRASARTRLPGGAQLVIGLVVLIAVRTVLGRLL